MSLPSATEIQGTVATEMKHCKVNVNNSKEWHHLRRGLGVWFVPHPLAGPLQNCLLRPCYRKFISNLSSVLAPLNRLLQKGVTWTWGKEQKRAFIEAKGQLTSTSVLTHYDPQKTLLLSCNASPHGVGAVISHPLEDESERPIAFASSTLSASEKNIPNWTIRICPLS